MQTEQAYRAKFAISQSAIKDWKNLPPQKWYDKWILKKGKGKKSNALDFGSLLDTLCFSEDQYERRFLVSEKKKPSDKVSQIVEAVYAHLIELNENIKTLNEAPAEEGKEKIIVPYKKVTLVDNKEVIQKYTVELDHYASKPEQGYNDVVQKGSDYFELVKQAGKRIVITKVQEDLAKELKKILFEDKMCSGFFKPKKNCSVYFQVQIFTNYEVSGFDSVESLPIKCMLDILHFNHKLKQVREIDLKFTEQGVHKFADYGGPARTFDYPLQHSFYNAFIPEFLQTFEGGKYKDYALMNPLNVVIDDDIKVPYVFEYNANDMYIKRYGMENTSIKGWEDTLNEIAWHLDNNEWSRPKEHIKNGKLLINIYKK